MDENQEIQEDFENLYIEIHKKESEIQNIVKKAQLAKLQKINEVKKNYRTKLQDLENTLNIDSKKREDEIVHNLQRYFKEIDMENENYFSTLEQVIHDKKDEMLDLTIKKQLNV